MSCTALPMTTMRPAKIFQAQTVMEVSPAPVPKNGNPNPDGWTPLILPVVVTVKFQSWVSPSVGDSQLTARISQDEWSFGGPHVTVNTALHQWHAELNTLSEPYAVARVSTWS